MHTCEHNLNFDHNEVNGRAIGEKSWNGIPPEFVSVLLNVHCLVTLLVKHCTVIIASFKHY